MLHAGIYYTTILFKMSLALVHYLREGEFNMWQVNDTFSDDHRQTHGTKRKRHRTQTVFIQHMVYRYPKEVTITKYNLIPYFQ